FGDRFVAGDVPGVTYTAARCRDFREYHPEAATCAAAATAHHADEVSDYRVEAGILGAAVAGGAWAWRRRRRRRSSPSPSGRVVARAVGAGGGCPARRPDRGGGRHAVRRGRPRPGGPGPRRPGERRHRRRRRPVAERRDRGPGGRRRLRRVAATHPGGPGGAGHLIVPAADREVLT